MKTLELNINHSTRPRNLALELKQINLGRGDKLKITTQLDKEMVFIIVLVAFSILYRKKIQYADAVLKEIFSGSDSSEIKKKIVKEYGIEVEIDSKTKMNEETAWRIFSKAKLSGAYSYDEPEYDLNMIKEPNPGYRK